MFLERNHLHNVNNQQLAACASTWTDLERTFEPANKNSGNAKLYFTTGFSLYICFFFGDVKVYFLGSGPTHWQHSEKWQQFKKKNKLMNTLYFIRKMFSKCNFPMNPCESSCLTNNDDNDDIFNIDNIWSETSLWSDLSVGWSVCWLLVGGQSTWLSKTKGTYSSILLFACCA